MSSKNKSKLTCREDEDGYCRGKIKKDGYDKDGKIIWTHTKKCNQETKAHCKKRHKNKEINPA